MVGEMGGNAPGPAAKTFPFFKRSIPMRPTVPDWAAVRADYESDGGTLAEIRARHGVTQTQLNDRKRDEAWTPRRAGSAQTSGARLARRLLAMLERIAHGMETKLMAGKDVDANELRLLD